MEWYFDFISPFVYLQHNRIREISAKTNVTYKPILLAALLHHCGHKGPAEIARKRIFTYQYVIWYAKKNQIPLKFPPGHPFNPLRSLRLSQALGNDHEVVSKIASFIWAEGRDINDDASFLELGHRLGVDDALSVVGEDAVKNQIKANTMEAIEKGLFGVPTLLAGKHLFWGNDATDMALDYLADPSSMESEEMEGVYHLPQQATRQ